MCNLYTQSKSIDEVARLFREVELPLHFPDGVPNLQPRDIRITDSGPIVRASPGNCQFDLVLRRWSWPGTNGRPVYNFRSERREFTSGRCLIVADGFYEFTDPADPKQKLKDRWLFTSRDQPLIGIAGLARDASGIGEAFAMLTTEPGPDVSSYHDRQVAVLPIAAWRAWLDYSASARSLLRPLPMGSLDVRKVSA